VAAAAAAAGRPVRVVDLGCGNAYLTFAAHRWLSQRFPGVCTVGVDLRPDAVQRNTDRAAELGLTGLSFVAGSIDAVGLSQVVGPPVPEPAPASESVPDQAPGTVPGPAPASASGTVDLVLALHACDTATDQALARAVRWGAAVVLAAPCCHHDLQRQLAGSETVPEPYRPLVRHPILRERFADVLTDALRAEVLRMVGYRTEVVEFVDSRHTPRNVLLRAVRTGALPSSRRVREYLDLTAAWGVRPAVAALLAPELDPVLAGPTGEGPVR
jgi:SAM-dependent methyltransferase